MKVFVLSICLACVACNPLEKFSKTKGEKKFSDANSLQDDRSTEEELSKLDLTLQLKATLKHLNDAYQDVTKLKSDVAKLQGKLDGVGQNVDSLVEINLKQDQQIKAIQTKEEKVIAFSAYVSTTRHLVNRDILIFDMIVSNVGGAYAGICGIFRAPIHGLYLFTVHFITNTHSGPSTNLDIMINKQRRCIAYADGAVRHTTGVCTVLAELKAGETAYVQHEDPHGDGGVVYNGYYTGFTGYLYAAL